jgi:phage-related protein
MSQALTTLGAAATTAQRPFEEQLAVLGMLQATMPGGEAGTKYKAFIKAAAKAGQELCLSFVDSNNQLLSMVEILDRLRGKYGETLDAMEKQQIQKAFGTEEAVALIDLLYGKVGELRSNIDTLGMSMRDGIAFTEQMARAMNNDLGANLEVLGQNIDILKRSIGDELSPLIQMAIPTVKDWVQGFQELAKTHPTLVRSALLLAAIGGVALAVLAPILAIGSGLIMLAGYTIWSFGQIRKAFARLFPWLRGQGVRTFASMRLAMVRLWPMIGNLGARLLWLGHVASIYVRVGVQRLILGLGGLGRAAIRTAITALPPLIAAVWSFTAALLANPITWVVIAIVGLGAALYMLYRRWDEVTAFLKNTWVAMQNTFAKAREWFAGVFENIIAVAQQYGPMILAVLMPVIGIPMLIAQNWDKIKEIAGRIFGDLVEYIPAKIAEIIDAIKAKTAEFINSGKALIQAFVDGIKSVINKPVEVVKAGLQKVRRLLPFSDAKEGPLSTLTKSGMAFIDTFARGIVLRAPVLQAAVAGALDQGWSAASGMSLNTAPKVNLQGFIRESFRERESTYTRDHRPIVIVMGGQPRADNDYSDIIDMAYRYLHTQGD